MGVAPDQLVGGHTHIQLSEEKPITYRRSSA